MSEDANDDDQDAADPKTDEEGLDSVRAASDAQQVAARLRQRDIDYLDRYYEAANRYSQQYKVNPALVLGLGIESAFGTAGTYKNTGDAFGLTGGNTKHMTKASSAEDNIKKFFSIYGSRITGVGDDIDRFIDRLQARDVWKTDS